MQVENDLRFGLQLAIEASIPHIHNLDNKNISKLIANYSYTPLKYNVVYSGGNSNWSIEDVNVKTCDSYEDAIQYFNDNLKYLSSIFQTHYLKCMERFDIIPSELSCLDFVYLDFLFQDEFPYPHTWSGRKVVGYGKTEIYSSITKHSICFQTSLDRKRPIRLDFIGPHKLYELYILWKNHEYNKEEQQECLDEHMKEMFHIVSLV